MRIARVKFLAAISVLAIMIFRNLQFSTTREYQNSPFFEIFRGSQFATSSEFSLLAVIRDLQFPRFANFWNSRFFELCDVPAGIVVTTLVGVQSRVRSLVPATTFVVARRQASLAYSAKQYCIRKRVPLSKTHARGKAPRTLVRDKGLHILTEYVYRCSYPFSKPLKFCPSLNKIADDPAPIKFPMFRRALCN